ncbi:MAG: PKD domain-containing protein, partial [Lewinella sp.]|nr:PKD domain-containing protein [Lewinella sp.]
DIGDLDSRTGFDPGVISYPAGVTGRKTIMVTATNRCGVAVDSQFVDILEPIAADAVIDTFACLNSNPTLLARDISKGDSLTYEWSVEPDAVIADQASRETTITFSLVGTYVVSLRVFNDVCGEDLWSDTVFISDQPTIDILPIPDFCETATFRPQAEFNLDTLLYTGIQWNFQGGMPLTSTYYAAETVTYQSPGDFTVQAIVTNGCGSAMDEEMFRIDSIPRIVLGPPDTICVSDGIYTLPAPTPPGGIWSGTGIIDGNAGTFDPGPPGSGTRTDTVTYTFTNGECIVSKTKAVFIVDLSDVEAGEDLSTCISDAKVPLNGGLPAGGWYEGPAVKEENGNFFFYPDALEEGTYNIFYYYQLPFTDCIGVDSFEAVVHPLPQPGMSGVDSLCINVPEVLTNTTTGGASYEWYIRNDRPSERFYAVTSPTHFFDTTGNHTIQLIATSSYGCVDSLTREVFVSAPPEAGFVMDSTMGCAVLPVSFDNISIGYEYVHFAWDFGNGDTSTAVQPGTVLFDQGLSDTTYYVSLYAENACGHDTFLDSVLVFPKPLPAIDISQPSGCTPLYIDINNFSKGKPDDFYWEILHNDNVLRTYTDSIPPTQLFEALDSINELYTIRLTATNECGTASAEKEVLVLPNTLRAFFSVDLVDGCEPMVVNTLNTTTPDTAVTYSWYFGDTNTSNDISPSHTFYARNDTITFYDIILVAQNACAVDSAKVTIRVAPAPRLAFQTDPYACAKDSTRFINTSPDEVVGFIYHFGDGDSLAMTNPWHVYDLPGTYTVEMTAFDAVTGCPNTVSNDILVRDIPKPDFAISDNFGCPPLEARFVNQTTDAEYFAWDFGDLNTDVGPDVNRHLYQQSGTFLVTLTATDEFGCSADTTKGTVEVYPVPDAHFDLPMQDSCELPVTLCPTNVTQNGGGYDWYLNENFLTDENSPCLQFTKEDTYTLELIVQNSFLCADSARTTFRIFDQPVADFGPLDTTICQGELLVVDNFSRSIDYSKWYINGVLVDTAYSFSRVLQDTGIFSLSLVVGNYSGCMDSLILIDNIRVNPTPTVDFQFVRLNDQPDFTYQFTDRSSMDVIDYWWDFGDGDTSLTKDPLHRYISISDKWVTEIGTNKFGCRDTATHLVDLDTVGFLYIPNILEPENGLNDEKRVFLPKGIGLEEYHITIYSRNGELVWESTALDDDGKPTEAWDGTYRGSA